GWKGNPIPAEVQAGGQLQFSEVPHGRVWLHGRVTWDRDRDEQLRTLEHVLIHVNGLKQAPVALDPPEAGRRVRSFRAAVTLSGAQRNQIEIDLPGLKLDAATRRQFSLNCREPEPLRAHLIVIGVDEEDRTRLTSRVLQALQATHVDLEQR